MGLRSRISQTDGSVSAEAAVGIGVVIVVMIALIQTLSIGFWQMSARAVLTEGIRVATASGIPESQVGIAREFIKHQLPGVVLSQEISDQGVRFVVRRVVQIPLLQWRPTVQVSEFGHWQDPWAGIS